MRLQENKYYQRKVFKFFQNLSLEKRVAFLQHFNSFYYNKMKLKKQSKAISEIIAEEEKRIEQQDTCEYCGRKIEDKNDTGSLCYRCYMREYYNS